MRSFACWDCGFESRRRHGCLSLVNDACCKVKASALGSPLVQRSLMCLCVCDRESWMLRRSWHTRCCHSVVVGVGGGGEVLRITL